MIKKNKKRLTVSIDKRLFEWLDINCKKYNITYSQVISGLILGNKWLIHPDSDCLDDLVHN